MLRDYHMHWEFGEYSIEYVDKFFEQAKKMELEEIGITEHSHGFIEFKDLYYDELILDNSDIGRFQRKWLEQKTKFCHSLTEYQEFVTDLKKRGYPIKLGLEVCNFKNQDKVRKILANYKWDYLIVSIHFINGWGFDFSSLKDNFYSKPLKEIWMDYYNEIENVAKTRYYNVLGHPFNLRIFKNIPRKEEVEEILFKTAKILKENNMIVDINTGTEHRYPIKEITPYPDFMKLIKEYDIPVILSSDAHYSEHVGYKIKEAMEYAKEFGINNFVKF